MQLKIVNYYLHEGVDFVAILSAALDNLRGVTRGGSTITSQVAKQSFVGDEISVRRKVAEAVVAAELERSDIQKIKFWNTT